MTLNELIENLEDMRGRARTGDVEVRLAMQPSYPMLGSPLNVCLERKKGGEDRVLIACSDHENYGCPSSAWDDDEIEDSEDED